MSRLRAPSADGAVLCVPEWNTWADLVEANRKLQATWQVEILGRSLADLRQQARRELLAAAICYSAQYRAVPQIDVHAVSDRPLVLGGHQPDLFHPGVWLKNFALDALARRVGGVAVNLVIDADTFKTCELPVPLHEGNRISRGTVSFDQTASPTVHESRRIVDPACFSSFGQRAATALQPWVAHPWIETIWPRVVERAAATGLIGAAFAQSRHQLEADCGLETLELPQSVICTQAVFQVFVQHLVVHRERFWNIYNDAIRDYRRHHHLRSASHPAPELRRFDEACELPFWTWGNDAGAKSTTWIVRDADRDVDLSKLVLRTKALATTLFARVFLGDLFVHGLGGGMYDQVTDQIIREFYGIEPPRYTIVTGTLRLPIARTGITAHDLQQHTMRRWAMLHHPETFIDAVTASPEVQSLIDEKRRWVAIVPTHANAAERCRAIRAINAKLRESLAAAFEHWSCEHQQLEDQLAADEVLGSREYPWPWYPRETLQKFLLAFRATTP